ncbi:MAG: DNA mismatch repair protein MutS [Verrucomicrobia bacterium]|nr:MAG: DNA mismatch repair protein MutS [Verrucomicrobiota bacterium]
MDDDPVEIPINGVLDLHTFKPSDLGTLIPDYLEACREDGIFDVRIIHGKGTGALRETVHAILRRRTDLVGFQLGNETSGGWGATLVTLRTKGSCLDS